MKHKPLFVLLTLLVLVGMVLSACKPAETPVAEEPAAEEPVAEEPAEEPAAEEPAEEMMACPTREAGELFWTDESRQAFAAAMDREAIVDRVFEGRNIPAYHMVPTGYPYATEPFLDKYGTRDLDMSIQILTDLGYSADCPFAFELWFPPEHYGTTTADVMQVLKEQLENSGD